VKGVLAVFLKKILIPSKTTFECVLAENGEVR